MACMDDIVVTNDSTVDSGGPTLTGLFDEALASCNGEGTAVRFNFLAPLSAMDERRLTYGQVNENADIIARHLRDLGAHRQIVACSSEPHVNVPSVMLGVMRVPSAFFFIDLTTQKQLKLLKDLHIKYLIADDDSVEDIIGADASVYVIRQLHGTFEGGLRLYDFKEIGSVRRYDYPNDWGLAYAVSTSGSTGTPKLVRVPHRCIVPNVVHFRTMYDVSATDVVLVASPMTFDPSVVDVFLALSSGASVILVPESVKRSPRVLASVMTEANRVSILQATPSLMKRFGVDLLRNVVLGPTTALRVLGLGGEPCPDLATLESWTERCRRDKNGKIGIEIYNVYGITEVSAWASLQRIDLDSRQTNSTDLQDSDVPLGEPIPGTEMIVLGKDTRRVHLGEGQLFLGGSMRKCFVDSEKFEDISQHDMLRPSGDYVRIDGKGQIFHLNRIDDKIKRNGKFVSLKQIEKASATFPNVSEARAVWNAPQTRIILAVVLDNYDELVGQSAAEQVFVQKLKNHVTRVCDSLPDGVVLLDSLPITSHGKFDERKVISLEADQLRKHHIGRSKDEVCSALKGVWNSSLGLNIYEDVGDESNFLLCGGDSIRAVALCEELPCRLSLKCPQLMDKILHENYGQVRQYLLDRIHEGDATSYSEVAILPETAPSTPIGSSTTSHEIVTKSVSRGSSYRKCIVTDDPKELKSKPSGSLFSISWRCNIGKCVDASPLLVIDNLDRYRYR